ncbi:MAG: hypothetical protein SPF23_02940 [Paludibacteraceae bacterium]|nr:hypothetical protein [Paludibacteraceae bacterium]
MTEAEYPTNYQRISNLSLTIRPFRVAILAVLLVFVGGWNTQAWGQLYGKAVGYVSPSGAGSVSVSYNNSSFTSWSTTSAENSGKGGSWLNSSWDFTMAFQAEESNAVYEFLGWYDNAAGTGTAISKSLSFTEGITSSTKNGNNKKNNPATITRYAVFKAKPVFYFKATATTNNSTYGNAYVTFTESNKATATTTEDKTNCYGTHYNTASMTKTAYFRAVPKTGYVFKGWSTTTSEDDIFNTDKSITYNLTSTKTNSASPEKIQYYAIFGEKFAPQITGTASVNKEVGDSYTADFSFVNTSFTTPSSSNTADFYYTIKHELSTSVNNGTNVISYNPSTGAIQTLNAGKATITFINKSTTTHEYAEESFIINVSKKTPAFKCGTSMNVDENLSCTYTNTSSYTPTANSSDNFYYVISNNTPTGNTNGSDTPEAILTFSENKIYGKNAGTATITFLQKETYKYTAASKTIEVTVKKYPNSISCSWGSWTKTLNFEKGANITFSSNNNLTSITPIVVTQTSGAENATYYPAPDNVIYGSYNNNASATWSVSQAENYKYVAATTQTLTVNVAKDADSGCDITLFTALTESSKKVSKTDQSNGFDLGGVGVKLSLHIKTNGFAGNEANLYTRTATTDWTYLQEVSAPPGGECDIHNIALPAGTTHIKFTKGGGTGTDDPYIKDIVVTRTHYFDIENAGGTAITELNMPQNTPTGNVKTATFYIDYSTCADKIKLVSSHDRIKFTANNSTTYEFSTTPNHYGRQAIEVSYTSPSEAEELHETITIFTPYDNKVLNINAETIGKLATYIHYIGDASYPVDAENIAASALFEVRDANNDLVPNATIILASNSEKAPIVENKVNPECGGNVTITASYSGDDAHEAAQDLNQTITIARLEDEVKIMLPSIMVVGDEYDLSNFVTAKSETNITFWSSNTSIVGFENGKLVVKSKGSGSATVRVTSAGNCIYNPGEEEIELTIRELTDPCNSLLLDSVHKANLGAYSGYTLRNPKKYVIADGPMDILTYKVWKYTAATQDIHIWLTSKDYTDANAGFNAEEDIIEEIVYLSTELPTSKDAAINGSIDMKVGDRPNTKYIFAFAADANYILPGTLYKYISNVKITQQCYLTGSTSSLSMPTVRACETAKAEFTVDYSDVGPIRLTSNAGDHLTYEVWKNGVKIDDFDNNCGDYGTYTIKLFYTPLTAGDYSGKVTISASGKEVDVDFSGTANAAEREIVWNVSNQNKAFVNKLVENVLTAYAKTDCVDPAGEVTYTIVPEGAATINGSSVTFNTTGTVTITAATVASGLYGAATPVSKTWNITEGYVFSGSGTWDVEGGWEGDLVPSTNQDVIVTGHLTIDGDRVVNSLTIEGTGSVTMVENGKLTINGTSKDAENYGNLYVLNGGEVEVNGDLKVGDLTVESSIGTDNGTAESGQVEKAENIVYANAYIEINMDPKGTMDDTKWYGFTVPFDVDAHAGISRKEGDTYRQCVYGTHYMIAEYDANKRLNTGKGWKYITGNTLYAGTFYYFTVNGNYNTYRFKAKEAAYTQAAPATLAMNGSTSNPNANWNAVGNSTLQHAKVSFEGGNYVQVYQNGLDAYRTVSASEATFVVGCPFFIQATEASTVVLDAPTSATESYYAPRRSSASQNGVARVNLTSVEGGYSDRIYVSGTDKEENAYIAGRDLAKAGESKVVPQLWVDTYNQKLSVHEAAWQGENAICPLGIYAPKEGEYTLTATQPEDGTQVYLTYNGQVLWNLTSSEYVLSLEKGTTTAYSLQIVKTPAITTGVDQMDGKCQTMRKVLMNDKIYIITSEGAMYDVLGKGVKF